MIFRQFVGHLEYCPDSQGKQALAVPAFQEDFVGSCLGLFFFTLTGLAREVHRHGRSGTQARVQSSFTASLPRLFKDTSIAGLDSRKSCLHHERACCMQATK